MAASGLDTLGAGAGGAGAMLAGSAGFPPLLMAALASMAPALLGKLFGGQDPQMKLRDQIMQLIQGKGALTNQIYNQNLASPAFSQAQGQIASGANATQGNLMASLGARGIGTSGTGSILSSVMPSIVGQQQAGLRTSAWQGAQNQANQQTQQEIGALSGTSGPSRNMNLFSGGLEALAPLLQGWLTQKYPGTFAPIGGQIGGGQ